MALNILFILFFLTAYIIGLIRLIFFHDATIFPDLINSTFDLAKEGFTLSLGLVGIMTLWLGFMRIGEKAGIIQILGKVVNPLFKRIFPELPDGHPAYSSMLMNIAANMIGLDNAATPLGLKAMQQLQDANPQKDTASNAQIMFLVMNTSGLCIIPVSIMMYRAECGAMNPSDIFIPVILATFFSTIGGITACSIIQRIKIFDKIILAYFFGITSFIVFIIWTFSTLPQESVQTISLVAGNTILFTVIAGFILYGVKRKVNIYEAFIEGAKGGFQIGVKIIPYIVGILVAIGVFRTSGALNYLINGLESTLHFFGMNTDFIPALPTGLMRPLSGSGARGFMIDTMNTYGADSFVGRLSSIFNGSTDTTFYILAVYFGSVAIKKTRHAVAAGLIADIIGIIASIIIGYIFFY
ncbi:hypothetical protein JW824_09905 [bacterium]|nr:hypothetical protein [bacterium]RQV94401.1 MAG: hypothetical protein EH221_08100 [bacterium]